MQSGMINKVAIIKANNIDSKGMKHVTPKKVELFTQIKTTAIKMLKQ